MITLRSLNQKMIAAVFLTVFASVYIGRAIATLHFNTPLVAISFLVLFLVAIRFPRFALIVMVFCMLLSPEISLGKIPGRNIVVRIEDIVIMSLLFGQLARMAVRKDNVVFNKAPINKFIFLYCAIFVISTGRGIIIAGIHPLKGTFYILKYLEYFVIYFLALDLIKGKKQIKLLIQVFLITFAIVNIYAISQHLMGGRVVRVSAPFEGSGEPNTLGGYQVLILSVVIGLLLHLKNHSWRLVLFSLAVLTIYPFIYTLSRSSYLAVMGMWITFIVFHKSKRIFLFFALVLTIMCARFILPEVVKARVMYTFTAQKTQVTDTQEILGVKFGPSASARIESWKEMFNYWKKSPLLGYGVTGLGFIDSQYVRILVELGALGLFSFLILLVSMLRNVLRIYRNSNDDFFKGISIGFLAGHIGMIIHAIGSNTYILIRVMEPYWFLAAIIMLIPKIESAMNQEEEIVQAEVIRNGPELNNVNLI